jgi:hypothetical protein
MGMDINGKSGNYFRADLDSWEPILAMCMELNETKSRLLNLDSWHVNDGAGLHTQEDCNKLADAIENAVNEGSFKYEISDYQGRTALHILAQPRGNTHCTDKEHVMEFVKFLRECGGEFEIY